MNYFSLVVAGFLSFSVSLNAMEESLTVEEYLNKKRTTSYTKIQSILDYLQETYDQLKNMPDGCTQEEIIKIDCNTTQIEKWKNLLKENPDDTFTILDKINAAYFSARIEYAEFKDIPLNTALSAKQCFLLPIFQQLASSLDALNKLGRKNFNDELILATAHVPQLDPVEVESWECEEFESGMFMLIE
jgi:hypothetical protein